ncbi:hypothetical protein P9A16_27940 [Shinella sp. 838]|uniref:hypothetical protein n=1 Tax=Shinella sp. 838 TaxID=3038164 RepID=UPI00241566D1|nr:hypothetical protein [Shinella sp. 838]MDG4674956.1 hypothetical protein [Shinella sp. 838]
MVALADHLSLDELDHEYRSGKDGTTARHYEVIRLLARGHSTTQVSALSGFGMRWIEELVVSMPREFSPEGGADKFLDCLCCNSKVPAVFGWANPAQ